MSVIIHRCSCGHPDIYHQHRDNPGVGHCSYGACHARVHEYGVPEVIPTFVDGQVNEFVHAPGGTTSGFNLCDCEDCRALFTEVRNDVPALHPWYSRDAS